MTGAGFGNFTGGAQRCQHVDAAQTSQAVHGSHDADWVVVDPGPAAFLCAQRIKVGAVHNDTTWLAQQLALP